MAFQKETIIDFSEVRKCPQVLLEQMKLCMTSSLLGLISDLWTGNNKDPDVMETNEWGKIKKKKRIMKKKIPHGYVSSPEQNLGVWYPFAFFFVNQSAPRIHTWMHAHTHANTHAKDCHICLSLVFIDPGMEKWVSWLSFNQTVIGISCMCACVCVSVCMVDIGCQQILMQTCQGGGPKRVRNLNLG